VQERDASTPDARIAAAEVAAGARAPAAADRAERADTPRRAAPSAPAIAAAAPPAPRSGAAAASTEARARAAEGSVAGAAAGTDPAARPPPPSGEKCVSELETMLRDRRRDDARRLLGECRARFPSFEFPPALVRELAAP